MNRTTFPESSNTKLVIRGKGDGFGYIDRIDIGPNQQPPLPAEEIRTIVRECNKQVNGLYCTKRKNDEYDFLKSNAVFLKMIFLISIVGFVILTISDYNREKEALFYVGLAVLGLSGLLVIVIASLLIFREKKHINLFKAMDATLTKYFDAVNASLKTKNAAFTIEKEHRWIELHWT